MFAAATTIKLGPAGARDPAALCQLISHHHSSTALSRQTLQLGGAWLWMQGPVAGCGCVMEALVSAALG